LPQRESATREVKIYPLLEHPVLWAFRLAESLPSTHFQQCDQLRFVPFIEAHINTLSLIEKPAV
jgi:hypothetical protein